MASKRPADRIAAAKAADLKRQTADKLLAEATARRDKIRDLRDQAAALTTSALARLEADGCPGIEQLDVSMTARGAWRLIGTTRPIRRGSYMLFEYSWMESRTRPAGIGWTRLLTDGQILVGLRAWALTEFVHQVAENEGLGPKATFTTYEPFSLAGLRTLVEHLTRLAQPSAPTNGNGNGDIPQVEVVHTDATDTSDDPDDPEPSPHPRAPSVRFDTGPRDRASRARP